MGGVYSHLFPSEPDKPAENNPATEKLNNAEDPAMDELNPTKELKNKVKKNPRSTDDLQIYLVNYNVGFFTTTT